MADKIIPLIPNSNQSLACTLPVDGKNITLGFVFTFNAVGNYWYMSVSRDGVLLLDAVPMVTGDYPASDILGQYGYLGIGSAYVVPTSSTAVGIPNDDNLGTDYVLVWSDTFGG